MSGAATSSRPDDAPVVNEGGVSRGANEPSPEVICRRLNDGFPNRMHLRSETQSEADLTKSFIARGNLYAEENYP